MASTAEVWEGVLSWLDTFDGGSEAVRGVKLVDTPAGRGLVAENKIKPDTILISVPNKALVNTSTLQALYPVRVTRGLTSTQMISLHLALQIRRQQFPSSQRTSTTRDRYWPFLATLPRNFPTVPLTWMVGVMNEETLRREYNLGAEEAALAILDPRELDKWRTLVQLMPRSVSVRAIDVERRFKSDWVVVKKHWSKLSEIDKEGDQLVFGDFLLGWLNVNTRCVYMELGGKTSDNLTLAPVIDMINHQDGLETRPVHSALALTFSSPAYGSTDPSLLPNQELAFSYGAHEDPMLLTEYGFTLGSKNTYNNVSLDAEIEALFKAQGAQGSSKKTILEESGYWGGMTLQASPPPASPSWRVLAALRLLHVRLPQTHQTVKDDILEPWYDVIQGMSETISDYNEKQVSQTLRDICEELEVEFVKQLTLLVELQGTWKGVNISADLKTSLGMVKSVCQEERNIVLEVLEDLDEG